MSEQTTEGGVEVGGCYKVFLPGESPWADCVAVLPDGRWVGRIANVTVASNPEMRAEIGEWFGSQTALPKTHEYKLDDLVIFERVNVFDDVWNWRPSGQQVAGGRA